ncbi:reprolysin-like metallopeptidase [Streptomyces sp. NPDC058989]|uniref:reprolysin-like metallopeptidase n=1 Tax=Streptomyces sp. NPDC058989 TaxID=3346686 RepID=UPI0036A67B5E
MTTQESGSRSEFDTLVRAVVDEIAHRTGGDVGIRPQVGQDVEQARAQGQRSGVYRRTEQPISHLLERGGAQAMPMPGTGPSGEAQSVAASMASPAAVPESGPTAEQRTTAGQTPAETVRSSAAAGSFEELRVDVDGPAPTMTVSGTVWRLPTGGATWLAEVARQADGSLAGPISYRDGNTSLRPGTSIRVQLTGQPPLQPFGAVVTFMKPGVPDEVVGYTQATPHFREVGIEYDRVEDAVQIDAYSLHDHPVRPQDLPDITLTVEDAFTRQGIQVTRNGGSNVIPLSTAVNGRWSDIEMHDAMQQHWSQWRPGPSGEGIAQWQVWTLFAGLHDEGKDLGGIMFDDIGAAQRQGCAIFSKSFISDRPPNDPAPEAYVRRMGFWTAVHEIGHCFNLAHAWQKSLRTPWMPLADEPEGRSFMNYPFLVNGGPQAFFSDFRYFFSEDELRFLRHAPERFVEQGNIPWFDHHGFEQARRSGSDGALQLTLRVNRDADRQGAYRFAMLEPVIGELKLTNTSTVPKMVDRNTLVGDNLSVFVRREDGTEASVLQPYLRYCKQPAPVMVQPGESLYEQVVLSFGVGGWKIAEPGAYQVYAALRTAPENASSAVSAAPTGQVLAAPLPIRVERPASREQERLADDVCTDTVGRVLALGGSRVMDDANDVLREVTDRIPDELVAKHAAACLSTAATIPGKVMSDGGARRIEARGTDADAGMELARRAYEDLDTAAETFGHIRLTRNVEAIAVALDEQDRREPATQLLGRLAQTLQDRQVKPRVVERVQQLEQRIAGSDGSGTGRT